MTVTPLPDAAPTNWVDRFAPPHLRPWLRLGRFDRPAPVWLLILPGWQGIALADAMLGRLPDPVLLGLFVLGGALMRAAGCAYNDIVDRDIDAKVARTAGRPIPSGQISVRGAWMFVISCCLASFLILISLNVLSIILGVASLALVAAYPFMKRITWWPQAWLGLTFNWGALLGYASAQLLPSLVNGLHAGRQMLISPGAALEFGHGFQIQIPVFWRVDGGMVYILPALLLYASGVFWTLGYDTIYAVQDLEDDALAGVKSSARRLGAAAPRAVLIFYVIAFAFALAAWWAGLLGPLFLPVAALFGAHLALQPARLRLNDPAGALAIFKSNTIAGLLLFLALVAGSWRSGL